MTKKNDIVLRAMVKEDYEQVHALWERMSGFAVRSLDDSYPFVARFLQRNPTTSVVALDGDKIVGSILCGHDGRQATFYHVCVEPEYRKHGLGHTMVNYCLAALAEEGISKAMLVAFNDNEGGNAFWKSIGWTPREDLNSYEFMLNKENILHYVD